MKVLPRIVEPVADASVIKAAWRKRMKTAHPDQGGTREEYEQVQSAYEQAVKMTVNA